MGYNVEQVHNRVLGIQTKFMPATNIKGARIKATAEEHGSVTVSYGYDGSDLKQHYQAACDLIALKFHGTKFKPKYTGRYVDVKTGYIFIYDLFYNG